MTTSLAQILLDTCSHVAATVLRWNRKIDTVNKGVGDEHMKGLVVRKLSNIDVFYC